MERDYVRLEEKKANKGLVGEWVTVDHWGTILPYAEHISELLPVG